MKLFEILFVSLSLGLTSFGGPIAHLGYFHAAYVQKRKWISEELYTDLVALCQFLPGPASSQLGIAIGTYRGGLLGGILAWIGFTAPSAIALVLAFYGLQEIDPVRLQWIHGLKIVAVAVVAQAVWSMATKLASDKERASIAIVAALSILLIPYAFTQIAIIVLAGFLGAMLARVKSARFEHPVVFPVSKRYGAMSLGLMVVLLIGLPLFSRLHFNPLIDLFDSFFRIGSLVFGGGHVVLPLLEKEVVPVGLVGKSQFLTGYGLTQAVPGPLFTFAAYLGAVIGGWPVAALTTFAIFLPSFLMVVGVVPYWDGLRRLPQLQSGLWGINAAVVGILLAALFDPVWVSAIRNPVDFSIALLCFGLLQFWKLPPWCIVLLCLPAIVLNGILNKLFLMSQPIIFNLHCLKKRKPDDSFIRLTPRCCVLGLRNLRF